MASAAQSELGPIMPPRWQVYRDARELYQLAQVALDCSITGPSENLPRALGAMDRMRAILGEQEEP